MGLVNLYLRSIVVLGLMFTGLTLVFTTLIIVAGLDSSFWVFGAIISLLFIFVQFLISPWLMDFTLPWIYNLNWYQIEQMEPHIANLITRLQENYNFNFKQIGIIEDNNPNAFTYGHFRRNARLVITRGIFNYLTHEEQQAVIAHEIGHVVHRDFIFMTIASAIPVLSYTMYAGLRFYANDLNRVAKKNTKDNQTGGIAAGLYLTAFGAWIVYFISGYLVLLLSRIREYYSDRFAGDVTGRPEDLSTALVKIAYGMIVEDATTANAIKQGKVTSKTRWQASFTKGVRAMGIFDSKSAKDMSMTIQGRGNKLDPTMVAAAASWDLSNPWAKLIEIHSTHPLPAKRLKALDKQTLDMGRPASFPDLGKVKPPESLWDEFLIELFLEYMLPVFVILFPIIIGYLGFIISRGSISIALGAGIGLLLMAFLWYYRKTVKYPKINKNQPVVNVTFPLTDMTKNSYYEASPVRGKAVAVEGIVVGRGTPGYFLSEDLVIQDNTGIIKLDYSALFPFMAWFFALFRTPNLMGTNVKVLGWYHRNPSPVIQVHRIYGEERTFKNHWAGFNNFFILLLVAIALLLIFVGLKPV